MRHVRADKQCWMWVALIGALAGGCVSQGPASLPVCPGKANVEEALSTLAAQAEKATSFRVSSGQCLLTYHSPEDGKQKRNNLFLKLWFNPPREIYVQVTIAADPTAIIVGSNDERFWLSLRPKEMSSYYEGQWSQVRGFDGLMISPMILLEAFGIVATESDVPGGPVWSLKNKGPFDILTRCDEAGRPTQRVYVHACDYRVRKIEYFNEHGDVVATTAMADYKQVGEEFSVPAQIKATLTGPDGLKDSMEIELSSMGAREISQAQRDRMFVPRGRERAEHVYRYEDGRWVPES
ncbi:MAG: hypothetical protein JW741_26135 [Sedimentisphaerales bacterium]|nr:hypothetical protein [Sedimentisphaerales bacterium]